MLRGGRAALAVAGCLLIATALGVHTFAQASFATTYQTTDFSGEWWAVGGDVPFAGRMPFEVGYTAELYDYSGLPFNDAIEAGVRGGNQTRLFHFGAAPPAAPPSWQGLSAAEWKYTAVPPRSGALKVVTSRLRAGYLRKNGVPYSTNTTMTEYYHRITAPNGDSWLTIISEVTDPENLREPFVLSTHFKKLPDGAAFTPEPCSTS